MKKFIWDKVDPNAPTERADFIVQWVKDLFRPDIKQAKGDLMRFDGSACCLGRACIVANLPKKEYKNIFTETNRYIFDNDEEQFLPKRLERFLSMDSAGEFARKDYPKVFKLLGGTSLTNANDEGKTFYTIGKVISSYPRAFFKNLTHEENEYIVAFGKTCPKWEAYRDARSKANKAVTKDQTGPQQT